MLSLRDFKSLEKKYPKREFNNTTVFRDVRTSGDNGWVVYFPGGWSHVDDVKKVVSELQEAIQYCEENP